LIGSTLARVGMVQKVPDLSRQLHTTVSILVWCEKCKKRVHSTYEPNGTGSVLKCDELTKNGKRCNGWCN